MLHHSLERNDASKMFYLLPIRSQLSIRLLLFTIVSYNLPSTDIKFTELQMGSKDGIPFTLLQGKREASMTTVRCRHLVGTEIAAHVKGVMNLVKRITGTARIIRITRMQTETNPPHLLEELPSLSKLLKNAEIHLPFVILK